VSLGRFPLKNPDAGESALNRGALRRGSIMIPLHLLHAGIDGGLRRLDALRQPGEICFEYSGFVDLLPRILHHFGHSPFLFLGSTSHKERKRGSHTKTLPTENFNVCQTQGITPMCAKAGKRPVCGPGVSTRGVRKA